MLRRNRSVWPRARNGSNPAVAAAPQGAALAPPVLLQYLTRLPLGSRPAWPARCRVHTASIACEQICVTPTTFCGVSLPRNGIVVTRSGEQIGWVDAFAAGVWTMTIAIIAVAWLAFLVGFVCLRLWVTREAPRGAAEEVPLGSPVQHRKRSDWCRPRRPDAHRRMRIPGAVSRRAGLVRSQPALPDQREGVSGGSSRVSVQRTRPDKAGCPSVDGHRWLQARDRPF